MSYFHFLYKVDVLIRKIFSSNVLIQHKVFDHRIKQEVSMRSVDVMTSISSSVFRAVWALFTLQDDHEHCKLQTVTKREKGDHKYLNIPRMINGYYFIFLLSRGWKKAQKEQQNENRTPRSSWYYTLIECKFCFSLRTWTSLDNYFYNQPSKFYMKGSLHLFRKQMDSKKYSSLDVLCDNNGWRCKRYGRLFIIHSHPLV